MMSWLTGIFKVDIYLVLATWILFAAIFHFSQAVKVAPKGNPYVTFCVQIGMFMNIVWLATGAAYWYNFGFFWEFVKLMLACLAIPVLAIPFTIVGGEKAWDKIVLYIAMPIAIGSFCYIFPRLNWFGLI